jgi:hypothetical protein
MKNAFSKLYKQPMAIQQQSTFTQDGAMKTRGLTWPKLGLFAAMAFTMVLPVMAQCDTIQCTGKIGSLDVTGTPLSGFPNKAYVFVTIAPPADMHTLDCTLQSNAYATLQPDNPGYDQIFSLLQASKIAGKVVKVRVNTSSKNCSIAYVVATP